MFNTIQIKIPVGFFADINKLTLKFIWKCKNTLNDISKAIWERIHLEESHYLMSILSHKGYFKILKPNETCLIKFWRFLVPAAPSFLHFFSIWNRNAYHCCPMAVLPWHFGGRILVFWFYTATDGRNFAPPYIIPSVSSISDLDGEIWDFELIFRWGF